MPALRRNLEPDEAHCDRCDFFGFERRESGGWAYCWMKQRHFPDSVAPGKHVCGRMRFGGEWVFAGKDKEAGK